jgi:ubiquinone/menaquinone biosynthesis C-methylase UbiE
MSSADTVFQGSIPGIYDRYLGPLLFEPFADDLAARVAEGRPRDILETAAGTGIVTAALVRYLPDADIVATDLNAAMLKIAAALIGKGKVSFRPLDAQNLPFDDGSFDAVVCQFGVMFFPDRIRAYQEARRVLRPGGRFLFNAWTRLEDNVASERASAAVAALYANDPPSFFRRVPHGYGDKAVIAADLQAAGFEQITIETIEKRSRSPSAEEAAFGICQGTPLRAEIEARAEAGLAEATRAAAAALAPLCGPDGVDAPMSAQVVTALR